jgi:DNA-binding beta-propeller fold protein YncE
MRSKETGAKLLATTAALASLAGPAMAPATAPAAGGFGPLGGPTGCLVAPGTSSAESGTGSCGEGKGLIGANAVAVSPDGANVYVAGGTAGSTAATSFGDVAILKRDPATGSVTETGCLSSDGTDGRDGARGACTPTASLLGADGVAVSPDGSTVFVASNFSASVVAFSRDPATGALTRLGCFQGRPPAGSPCPAANVFVGSSALTASADNKALYIAAPTAGSISTLIAGSIAPPTSATASSSVSAGSSVASIFGLPVSQFVANPCIAVNGFDGPCAVGTATQGLDALALSPDGKQLYGAAPGSHAVDVFTPDATTGALTESGCLKVAPPPGPCSASKLIQSPSGLATSPDGRNVYASDSSGPGGSVDVLTRDASTGALSDSSCVDFQPQETHQEPGEEEAEESHEPPPPPGPCVSVPGLDNVRVVAVSGDGSSVYAIGNGSAAIFSRDASTGKLTETSCAANQDSRCTSLPSLQGIDGAAVSPDGRDVYVAAGSSNAVTVFAIGAAVASAHAASTHAGTSSVRVICPAGLRRPCSGRVELTRVIAHWSRGKHRVHLARVVAGSSSRFTIRPGLHATVEVRLSRSARRALLARRHLRLMAVVRADPLAGGSGYGRRIVLSLTRR